MSKSNGGPAFPRTMWTGSDKNAAHRDIEGMTMCDAFAIAAMQGLVASAFKHLAVEKYEGPVTEGATAIMREIGDTAYIIADAMLAAKEKHDGR